MKGILKKIFAGICCLVTYSMVFGSTYYVSSSGGNDSHNGQSVESAWQTLGKVQEMIDNNTINSGDDVLFKKGDVFIGSVQIKYLNNLRIGSYGSGKKPVFKGSKEVKNLSQSGNIWSISDSEFPNSEIIEGIYINNKFQNIGKYPDSGFLTIDSHSGKNTIYCNSMEGSDNQWNNADVIVRSHKWRYNRRNISEHSNKTFVMSTGADYELINGFGFFLINHEKCLDDNGDWLYSPGNKTLKIYYSGNINQNTIEVPVHDYGIYIDNSEDIVIHDISFKHYNKSCIYNTNQKNVNISECTFKYSYMAVCGRNSNGKDIIESCSTDSIFGTCIGYVRSDFKVSNCEINNTGLFPSMVNHDMPKSIPQFCGISLYDGNAQAAFNKITNTGYIGISCLDTVKYNIVDSFCSVLNDGGGIYGGSNSMIAYNIVKNGLDAAEGAKSNGGVGIYFDGNTSNEIARNNIIMNVYTGFQVNYGNNRIIYDNMIYNSKYRGIYVNQNCINDSIYNNIVYQTDVKPAFWYSIGYSQSDCYIDNNYYLIPFQDKDSLILHQPSYAWYSFDNWLKTKKYDVDQNSKILSLSKQDFKDTLIINNGHSTEEYMVSALKDYVDINGSPYNKNFTLEPFESKLLFESVYDKEVDNNKPVAESKAVTINDDLNDGDIVTQVNATDEDTGQTLSYDIINGNENNTFVVSGDGQIMVQNSEFLDSHNLFELTLQVTDNGDPSLSAICYVSVTVNHVNDTSNLKNTVHIYINPEIINDPDEDGTIEHPFNSWNDVEWIEGYKYLQKRNTSTIEEKITISASNIEIGAYGEGAKPVIYSSEPGEAVKIYNQNNIIVKDLNIFANEAVSNIYLIENTSITIENCELMGAQYGLRIIDGDKYTVRYNTFKNDVDGVFAIAENIELYYNIFKGNRVGINSTSYSSNIMAYNNVFYDNEIGISSAYSSLTLYNNIFYLVKAGDMAINQSIDEIISDYNIFYPEQDGFISISGNPINSLSDLQNAYGLDIHSFTMDPLFVDAFNDDFSILPGSPASDNGTDVQILLDILGNEVPNNNAPDIGVVESNYEKSKTTAANNIYGGMSDHQFEIYPNPSKGLFNLRLNSDIGDGFLQIFDNNGKNVYSTTFTGLDKVLRVHLNDISEGIYHVIVQSRHTRHTGKLNIVY